MTELEQRLAQLAQELGEATPSVPERAPHDLTGPAGGGLLDSVDRLANATRADTETACSALRRWCGLPESTEVTWTRGREAARAAAESAARARTGRHEILDATTDPTPRVCDAVAAVIVEPFDRDMTAAWADQARSGGACLIVDETRCLGRTATGLAHRSFEIQADFCVLGEGLAAGLPIGAVIGPIREPVDAPTPLALTVATALADELHARPVADELERIGERIRTAFDASCAREDIHATLEGPGALMQFRFEGQENAEAPLMAHHFGLELERIGLTQDGGFVAPDASADDGAIRAWCDGIDRAVARMRCLLIEHNSYLCGGVRYPFPDGHPTVVDRGLALYRYPKLGPVELTSEPDCFRICFVGGELGEVTSSGFYLPTLFTGDFDIRCGYRVHAWQPGPDSACLALFAQNLASSKRYYAQRMSGGDEPDAHRVLGSLATVLSKSWPVAETFGQFRITRRDGVLTAYHRVEPTEEWTAMAVDDDATRDDVVFGVKIWSKVESGRIEATVHDLVIDAALADEQIPRLEHRDDPRQGR